MSTPPPTPDEELTRLCAEAMARGDWITAEQLGDQLDALTQPKPPPPMLAAALWYAEQALPVFPLQPRSKVPLARSHGFEDATTEADVIRTWWGIGPHRNIGIATGHLVDVIDVDGPLGVQSWARIPDLPQVLGTVGTPGDQNTQRARGSHLYVVAAGKGNVAGLWPGIDYRGRGGYVVAPPSIGPDGNRYRWRTPLEVPAHG
jgi:hypothetical protein